METLCGIVPEIPKGPLVAGWWLNRYNTKVDLETFHQLLQPAGQEALKAAELLEPRELDFLSHYTTLSRSIPSDLARAALEIAILRLEAETKFTSAGALYFTREALEQATPEQVSRYRSQRYQGCRMVADLGCSIGSDTVAFASQAFTVGVDIDPLRLRMAQANLAALDQQGRAAFVQADLTNPLPANLPANTGLFFDPARRVGGRRIYSTRDYHPPLSLVKTWMKRYPDIGVKLSPGVDLNELGEYPAEIEFISLRGDLKEAVLWLGRLRSAYRRATILPGPFTLVDTDWDESERLPVREPGAYLYEPDSAILRAGLVQALGAQLEAAQLDPDIAYLTADQLVENSFCEVLGSRGLAAI